MNLKNFSTKETPQNEPILGKNMVENSAGGYVFGVDKWERLHRFLILGSDGGTYYIKERKLEKQNIQSVLDCLKEDGRRTLDLAAAISDEGRAPKNDPAIFVLALALNYGEAVTDPTKHSKGKEAYDYETGIRAYAADITPKICRTGTHIFQLATFLRNLGGFGETKRRAINNWIFDKTRDQLAYQMVKYRMREGWTHHDMHHIVHPRGDDKPGFNDLFKWAKGGQAINELPQIIQGFELIQGTDPKNTKQIIDLITAFKLPHEAIPTECKNNPDVQAALIPHMPAMALIRNLGNFSKSRLVGPFSHTEKYIVERLSDSEWLKRSRIHPIAVLLALVTYESGHGYRGSGSWDVSRKIIDALNGAFYGTFGNVEPIGNNVMLALDVSGSMHGNRITNTNLSAAVGSCAMAMITARTEGNWVVGAFTAGTGHSHWSDKAFSIIPMSPMERLDDLVRRTQSLGFGGTDCALPMLTARDNNYPIDTFIIYTDSETWAGNVHPKQALDSYRQKSGRNARCIVVGMTSNGFSIADPTDSGMLDVVGFDTSVPNVMAEFARNN